MADENPPAQGTDAAPPDTSVETELAGVAAAAQEVADAAGLVAKPESRTVDFIKDVPLAVTIEVGRARMTIQDLLQLGQGSVVELEKLAGEPLDVFINGKRVAIGEAVIVNEKFGVRIKDIIPPDQRLIGMQ